MLNSRKVFIVDMDDTILRSSKYGYFASLDLLEFCIDTGLVEEKYSHRLKEIHTYLLANDFDLDRFYEEVIFLYRQAFKGVKENLLQLQTEEVAEQIYRNVSPFVWELFLKLKMQYCTILISGSFHDLVQSLAKRWGFDYAVGSRFLAENGIYSGHTKSVYGRKLEWLDNLILNPNNNLTWDESVGIGDAMSDFGYLQKVTYSIAFNPKQALYLRTKKRKDQIIVREDLSGYVFEQGQDRFAQLLKNNFCKAARK